MTTRIEIVPLKPEVKIVDTLTRHPELISLLEKLVDNVNPQTLRLPLTQETITASLKLSIGLINAIREEIDDPKPNPAQLN